MLAIGFLSYTALRASLRSILLTDDFDLYAKQRGLVFNHRAEPGIWPGVQALIHPCAIGDALSDAGQVAQDDSAHTLIDTHIHKPSAGDLEIPCVRIADERSSHYRLWSQTTLRHEEWQSVQVRREDGLLLSGMAFKTNRPE